MKLIDIAINNLRRKKGRTFFLVSGLAVGIGAAVALTSIGSAMNHEVMHTLDEFGANILVLPASEDLPLSYGGLTVSAVHTGGKTLTMEDAKNIRTIKDHQNISTVAPKLLVVTDQQNPMTGLHRDSEFTGCGTPRFVDDDPVIEVLDHTRCPVPDAHERACNDSS